MAWYRAGTIAVTNGSPVVTGTGTAFVANVQAGHAINLPDGRAYEVLQVNSDTQITLGNPAGYLGATASGQAYSVQPNQGFAQTTAQIIQGFLTQYSGYVSTSLAGRFGDGTAAAPGMSFSADQSTGWYRKASKTFAASCGGADVLVLAPSQVGLLTSILTATTLKLGTGGNGTGNRGFILDLIGDDTYTDFGMRIQRDTGGPNGTTYLAVRGTGTFNLFMPDAGTIAFTTGGAGRWTIGPTGILAPVSDNTTPLAGPSNRISQLYAGSSTINTSDENDKMWRGALNDAECAAAKEIAAEIGIYQWLDSIAEKGADAARLHVGVRAQRVWAIMASHGLVDPISPSASSSRYAFLAYDKWAAMPAVPAQAEVRDEDGKLIQMAVAAQPARPAGERYGIRTDQLALFCIAAQERRLAAIEAKLAA